jgi:hypothetical protein
MSRSGTRRTGGRQARRKQQNTNSLLIIGGGVLLVIILVAVGLALSRGTAQIGQQIESGVPPPSQHINNVTDPHPPYTTNPPTFGYHYVNPASGGIYQEPLPDEITIHNLEHGFIVIHYRQDLDPATLTQLTSLARELQQENSCLIMEPRAVDNLPDATIAMTAWNWLLKLETFDAEQIRTFFRGHVGRGPEQVCRPL